MKKAAPEEHVEDDRLRDVEREDGAPARRRPHPRGPKVFQRVRDIFAVSRLMPPGACSGALLVAVSGAYTLTVTVESGVGIAALQELATLVRSLRGVASVSMQEKPMKPEMTL